MAEAVHFVFPGRLTMSHSELHQALRSPLLWPRRTLLQAGATGLLGLAGRRVWGADEAQNAGRPRARSVVFLYQFGGPSHVDTFDMKPQAPDGIRSLYSPIATSLPGVEICDRLPETAKVLDKVTLVRTVHPGVGGVGPRWPVRNKEQGHTQTTKGRVAQRMRAELVARRYKTRPSPHRAAKRVRLRTQLVGGASVQQGGFLAAAAMAATRDFA